MAATTKKMTKRRLTQLLGLVQEADTPEQRDRAWDEIVAAFEFEKPKAKGVLANPLIAEACAALKGRLDGLGYSYDAAEVDRWFEEQGEDRFWILVFGPLLNDLEERVANALGLAEPEA